MPWDWVTFPEFLDSVERAPKAVNILPYMPIVAAADLGDGLRGGQGRQAADADEQHAEMRRLLHEAMDAGACGWSAQRCCRPGRRRCSATMTARRCRPT